MKCIRFFWTLVIESRGELYINNITLGMEQRSNIFLVEF